ncbi:MAG: DNA-binding transcriptional LysR family regulator, partial [Myxococcota bacterium]
SGFSLTPTGEDALELAREIALEMEALDERMAGRDSEISGNVRITIGDNFVTPLAPLFARLRAAFPALRVDILVRNDIVNLSSREADIAIRVGNTPDGTLAGRPIANMAMALYASRKYLAQHRQPRAIRELDWIGWDASWQNAHTDWMNATIPDDRVVTRVDSPAAMFALTRSGVGVAHLLCYLGDADPELARVEPGLAEFGAKLWILTRPELRTTQRVRSVIDFVEQELLKDRELIEGRARTNVRPGAVPDPHLPIR